MSNLKERDSPVGSIEQIFVCDRGERFGKLMVRHLDKELGQLHDEFHLHQMKLS